jgi:hypothetical protein
VTVANRYSYRLFGLNLVSELELPELGAGPSMDSPDAEICLGTLPAAIAPLSESPTPMDGGAAFEVPDIARYAVLGGRRIVVDSADGANARNVRLYLLGSAMGLLLHQRGVLPLHANAVEIDGQAFAFMGPSGAGKSTLAAWFHDRGLRIVADDVCAVHFDAHSRPWVSQGLPRLRLWKSALEATGRSGEQFERSYAGDERWDKFDVPLAQSDCDGEALPLAGVYALSSADDFSIEALDGVAAAEAIFANTYRGHYIDGAEQARNHWQSSLKLISATPIFSAARLWGFEEFDGQATRILDHARHLAGQTLRQAG